MARLPQSALLAAALLLAIPASAQIYKTTDEHGNVVFTDSPPPGEGEQVELPQTNTTPPPPVVAPIERPAPEPETVEAAPVE